MCILCQQTSPKRWFGNRTMTSFCDVTNSANQIQMTTQCHWMKPPREKFLRTPLFEQLSSYRGWRVITKKARANLLARAVVKGLNGNLRITSYMKKIPNYELSNISLVHNKILCTVVFCNSVLFFCVYLHFCVCLLCSVTLFYFLCVSTFSYFLCARSMLFGMKYTLCFFTLFVFFCFALFSSVPQ